MGAEFGYSKMIKKVPLENKKIYSFLNFRVAMNHSTVFFRKKVWSELGGYPENVFLKIIFFG